MGKYRKRFNEKARQGMLIKQNELRKVRQKQFTRHLDDGTGNGEDQDTTPTTQEPENTNAEIFQPMSKEEREAKKRKLEEQVRPKEESKISRAKKKRLDKYIEHQLKREEKQVLIEKLQESKFDTSLLKSSKLLGTGRQTKREDFAEALELERQGRGDERTKEILYEERQVRDWDEDHKDEPQLQQQEAQYDDQIDQDSDDNNDDDDGEDKFGSFGGETSSFIDLRPTSLGGTGTGFSFQNIPKVKKKIKKSYNWRAKLEAEDRRKHKIEDEQDFESDSDDEEEDQDEDEEKVDESDEEEQESNEEEVDDNEEIDDDEEVEDGEEDDEEEDDDEEDSEEDSEEDEDPEDEERKKFTHSSRAEAFKEWADQQIRKLEGREAPSAPSLPNVHYERVDRPEDLEDDLKEEFIPVDESSKRQAFYVNVERPDEIQKIRMQLPVFGEEHRIMEAIHHNDVVIICGETGSGKTTQVPQFLYESGYGTQSSPDTPGMIGITQPRRVAAVSMAERVSNELGNHGDKVGYQIRFDSTTKPDTRMKFMTDGVLLREMMTDFILNKYSSIIIDEAHERNINTDILIGMLSRVVKLRAQLNAKEPLKYKKLKLIIMSATLRVSDFSENPVLFDAPPPILKVEARQYPVSIHFNRRTSFNYIEEVVRKTCKIHKRLPPGGILIFLTGQSEITSVVKKLKKEFPFKNKKQQKQVQKENYDDEEVANVRINSKQAATEAEEVDFSVKVKENEEFDDDYDGNDDDDYEGEEEGFEETLEEGQTDQDPLYVLPLYSLLPTKEQMKVFKEPPAGSRLCIVATNVAETSLTIPGIRYVVDAGRSKERHFDDKTGVQSFEVDWVSKASAGQRAGRAGRTGPGHCYRLYSSAVFERDFQQFSKPEILRMPIESVVLSMKSMGIDNVVNFPFPTPPERIALSKAEKLLQFLGALTKENQITDLGKNMSYFPMSPRFAKMLIVGNQQNCLPYVVSIVSALSVGDPFINEMELGINETIQNDNDEDQNQEQESIEELEAKRKLRSKFHSSRTIFCKLDKYSDVLKLLSAVCAFDHVPTIKKDEFLRNHFLRPKPMEEISKLRKQVMYIVKSITTKESIAASVTEKELKLGVPSKIQVQVLKQMVSAGFVDQIAIRADLIDTDVKITNRTNIINIPYATLFPTKSDEENASPYVSIHPSSIICNAGEVPPSYLVYQSVNVGANNKPDSKILPKSRLRALTDITGKPLSNIAKNSGLITYSKPLGHPYAPKNITSTKRECYVVPRFGAAIGAGGIGWDLPPIKVIQNKIAGQWINE
ncbi:putative ATP-dependent RNA helicase [Wickerhamomyces ciferrii]|uniref:RNA helicase n=1 Tax=Wickerhamomyces ciferrii (strain ATCC 14091 / BCRC 22168 / CBS 111 / JCM 3599 / NBRC 0793 / NRRL Y-1031 F-60-10) TaxID=1206466 RepID=K0KSB4_WICCF|nr:putative ATP-dependent RNA helicase [Wickerhamomyces ciferrii]CCH46061.1 putative ATP-dependent RNA helicase [Wickerhamomyces ciferrii]